MNFPLLVFFCTRLFRQMQAVHKTLCTVLYLHPVVPGSLCQESRSPPGRKLCPRPPTQSLSFQFGSFRLSGVHKRSFESPARFDAPEWHPRFSQRAGMPPTKCLVPTTIGRRCGSGELRSTPGGKAPSTASTRYLPDQHASSVFCVINCSNFVGMGGVLDLFWSAKGQA